jgi:hypothetical protein
MDMSKDAIKTMIELSDTWQDADKVLDEFTPGKSINEKLYYLYGMFDVSILPPYENSDNKTETNYRAVLSAIVNQKWRNSDAA